MRLSPQRIDALNRRIRALAIATIAYNVIEAAVALAAGTGASSTALIGFGLDSVIEVLSAAVVTWQFSTPRPEERQRLAGRLIAVAFLALAAFVAVDATLSLIQRHAPEHSTVGIVIAALSVIIMPSIARLERDAGRELGSASAVSNSRQTLVCAYLSVALLAGLTLNALLGWWWADPVAALAIAALAAREGRSAWRGDVCCSHAPLTGSAARASTPDDECAACEHHR